MSYLNECSFSSRFTTHVIAELFARKLLGRTDIEDALKRLDCLIQEEVHMAIAQILKATAEVKDGTYPPLSTGHRRHTK